jgi:hypothetical protein
LSQTVHLEVQVGEQDIMMVLHHHILKHGVLLVLVQLVRLDKVTMVVYPTFWLAVVVVVRAVLVETQLQTEVMEESVYPVQLPALVYFMPAVVVAA